MLTSSEFPQLICEPKNVKLDIRRLHLAGFKGLIMDGVLAPIETTPCNFGGERRWFRCPYCNRRCAVLYRPDLRCRLCADGYYRTERMTPLERKIARSKKLRQKLGQYKPDIFTPLPDKPVRMRWRTFEEIRKEIVRLELEVAITKYPSLLQELKNYIPRPVP